MKKVPTMLGALVFVILAGFFFFLRRQESLVSDVPGEPAILGLEWGMNPEKVRERLGKDLQPASQDASFYRLVALEEKGRAAVFEIPSADFGSRKALLRFVFIDRKLRAYYFFLQDDNEQKLDGDVRAELERRFGPRYLSSEEGGAPLKALWSLESVDVNYWLLKNEFRLAPNYRAAIGVRYKKQ